MAEYLEQKNVMLRKIIQEKSCWNLISLLCEWKVSLCLNSVYFNLFFRYWIQAQLNFNGIWQWHSYAFSILDFPFHRFDIFISLTFQAMGCFIYFIRKITANKCNPVFVGKRCLFFGSTWATCFCLVYVGDDVVTF